MSKTFSTRIDITPVAQKRARVTKFGSYDPSKEDKVNLVKSTVLPDDFKVFESAIEVTVKFYLPIPKQTSKKRTKLMDEGKISHTKKPDLDNLVKLVLDAYNGVLYNDDSQIISLSLSKMYSITPGIEINITEIDDEE